ncbi:MAG TPA: hypothetical protein VMA34_02605 [Terracidiphilus sp.]|nr:hypothetical protein [Terracidiphilus sp.]
MLIYGCDADMILTALNAEQLPPMDDSPFVRLNDLAYRARQEAIQKHRGVWGGIGATLRGLVDEWIASGYDGEIETPGKRHLSSSLQRRLNDYWAKHPASVTVMVKGDLSISLALWKSLTDTADFATEAALRLFTEFLGSELKNAIGKCVRDGCGVYFTRERMREIYKRGAFCAAHGPVARIEALRGDEDKELMRLACDAWLRWTASKHPIRELWVAGEVNGQRRGTQRRITRKWITVNQKKIEAQLTKEEA